MIDEVSKNSLILETFLKNVPDNLKKNYHSWYIYKDILFKYERQELVYTKKGYAQCFHSLVKKPDGLGGETRKNFYPSDPEFYQYHPNKILHGLAILNKEEKIKEISYGVIFSNGDNTYSKFEITYEMDYEKDKAFICFKKCRINSDMSDNQEWVTGFIVVQDLENLINYDLSQVWPRELFIERYGHADIMMQRKPGSEGSGNVVEDGYSIGYEGALLSLNDKEENFIKFKIRQNISNVTQQVKYVIKFESSFDTNLDLCINSTADEYRMAPETHLELVANSSSQIFLSPGRINKDNIIEETKEKNNTPKAAKSTSFARVFKSNEDFIFSYDSYIPIMAKSSSFDSNLLIDRGFGIGYLTASKTDPSTQLLGHIWVAISQVDDDPLAPVNYPVMDENYIYLAGGNSKLREITKASIEMAEFAHEAVCAKITGKLPLKDIKYEIKVISLLTLKLPKVKVTIETGEFSLYGKLDIVSDIDFGFYKDGVIPLEMKPYQKFVFESK